MVLDIEEGYHGDTRLDGLRAACIYRWPGPIHEGKGERQMIIDRRATPAQRAALLRILNGEDSEPGATVFQVFTLMSDTTYEPVFADIEFKLDVDGRTARAVIPGVIETRGEPILNPVTGAQHRIRIEQPEGFEFTVAEIGRGWSKTAGPIAFDLTDSYGQFARLHLNQNGIVR